MKPPEVGDQAPNIQIRNSEGKTVQLADYWRSQPIVLAFLRHFG